MIELDDVEREIVSRVEDHRSLGFNDLLRGLESGKVRVSRSGLSRRLKRLVRLGLISKETYAGWPPSTRYEIARAHRCRLTRSLGASRRTIGASLFALLLVSSVLSAFVLVQHERISDLQSLLDSRERILTQHLRQLEEKAETLKRLEQLGLDLEEILRLQPDLGQAELLSPADPDDEDPPGYSSDTPRPSGALVIRVSPLAENPEWTMTGCGVRHLDGDWQLTAISLRRTGGTADLEIVTQTRTSGDQDPCDPNNIFLGVC